MVKNRLVTTSLREIKNSFPRFLSLLIMSFLGVFVFSGLKATAPAMMDSLDQYYKEANTYDIKLTSTLGFDNLDYFSDIEEIKDIELSNYNDTPFKGKNDKDYVIQIASVTSSLNKLDYDISSLKDNELLVEKAFIEKSEYQIGDTITFDETCFKNNTFVIKGVVDSTLFFSNADLSNNRGKTNVGNGTINFYGFTTLNTFSLDYYKNIYITVKDANLYQTNSKKYVDLIDNVKNKLVLKEEKVLKNRLDKVKEIYEPLKEVNDNIIKYNEEKKLIDYYLGLLNMSQDEFKVYFSQLDKNDANYSLYKQLYDGIILYENSTEEYNNLLSQIEAQGYTIESFNNYVNSLKRIVDNARMYVYDRLDNSTYKSYIDDTNSITNLAYVFPLVFYAVAILVSLVSMNRMVEDDRLMLGTFKSLGFSNNQILFKYMLFALLATLIGGILGVGLGVIIIPSMINSIYRILFDLPKFYINLNFKDSLIGFIIAVICIGGATLFTLVKELKAKPAELLRPKAPKPGKRILLEKWHAVWNRIKFSNKITIRNISRYKKRVIVTTLGIAGCCALMLCGFGIRDSISDIPEKQFGYVTSQDATVYFSNISKKEADNLLTQDEIVSHSNVSLINGETGQYDITINVLENGYEEFQHFYDIKTKENLSLNDNEVFISDKLAQLLSLSKGDKIEFNDNNYNSYSFTIAAVVENYIYHYVYMTESTYKQVTNEEMIVNTAYIKLKNLNEEEKENFQKKLLNNEDILNVTFVQDAIDSADDMLQSLNKVVIILIVLAALLSFIVLYNLSNINIHERKREIATLKVLGFYQKEVDHYITQENIILTIIGIIIGLIFGYFLTNIVISTVEIEYVRFIHKIKFLSFVYASLLSILFTLIVNLITHFSLEKIDMIESLKSVE